MTAKQYDEPKPSPFAPVATPAAVPYLTADDLLTEQEKDTTSLMPGVGPAEPSQHSTGPVETIEDLGIGPREPYPTADTPPPPEGGATAKKGKAK